MVLKSELSLHDPMTSKQPSPTDCCTMLTSAAAVCTLVITRDSSNNIKITSVIEKLKKLLKHQMNVIININF